MNKAILMGRLTRDPEVRYATSGDNQICIARYAIAIDRRKNPNSNEEPGADFIQCVAMGKNGEFAEKYLKKGTKIAIEGRIQTGSYTNKDGVKVYTTEVVIEKHEFCESKSGSSADREARDEASLQGYTGDGFMNIPDGIDEDLPFS